MRNAIFGYGLATALMFVVVAPAFAQSSPKNATAIDTIIVTARRSQEKLQDVPISITVLSQELLTKHNIYNGGDLGLYVPSLTTNNNFGTQKNSFVIRGFTQEGKTAPSVAVYFADVVSPRSNGGTTSGNGTGVGAFMDLENVQVLKGPQGTLFGRNTTGGAILLVPAKPADKFEGSVGVSAGDFGMHRLEAMLNVPVSPTLRVRAAVDYNKRNGFLNNISGIGPAHLGDTNYISARLSVVADLTPDLENYTIGSFSNSRTKGETSTLTVCDQHPTQPLAQFLAPLACAQIAQQNARGGGFWNVDQNDPNPFERVKQWQIINTTTWRSSDALTVKNIVSYAQYKERSDFDLEGDNFAIPIAPGFAFPVKTILLEPGFSGNNSAESTLTEELQFQGKSGDGRFKWQAGAYLEVSKPLGFSSGLTDIFINCSDIRSFQCTNPLGFGSISDSQVKDTFNNKGLYTQATYNLTDQFSLTGGFRYTMDRITDESQNANINVPVPGTGVFTCQNRLLFNGGTLAIPKIVTDTAQCDAIIKIKSNRPTWLIGLDYKPSDDVLLYAKWSRGYRQGAINSNNVGLETVVPEKVDTFEIGAKSSFRGTVPGYFNVAGFYNSLRNQQLAVNSVVAAAFNGIISPAQPIVNAGKSRIWGIEVDSSVIPFAGFKIDLGYTYLNTKLLSFTPPALPIYYAALIPSADVGQPLALSPKNRLSLTGTYTLPLNESIGTVSFAATLTHTDANRAVSPNASPNFYLLPKSDQLNLNADWISAFGKPVDVSFFMTNVTNEKRILYPNTSFFTIGAEGGHIGLPRMWGFRLKYHFGD